MSTRRKPSLYVKKSKKWIFPQFFGQKFSRFRSYSRICSGRFEKIKLTQKSYLTYKIIHFFRKWSISWSSADQTWYLQTGLWAIYKAFMGIKMTVKFDWAHFRSRLVVPMTSWPHYDVTDEQAIFHSSRIKSLSFSMKTFILYWNWS